MCPCTIYIFAVLASALQAAGEQSTVDDAAVHASHLSSLDVRVRHENGSVAGGVEISLKAEHGKVLGPFKTEPDGTYTFTGLSPEDGYVAILAGDTQVGFGSAKRRWQLRDAEITLRRSVEDEREIAYSQQVPDSFDVTAVTYTAAYAPVCETHERVVEYFQPQQYLFVPVYYEAPQPNPTWCPSTWFGH